jgi:hypothetical protein
MEQQKINITHSECVCSLSYPGHEKRAQYFTVIFGLSGSYRIFPHYLTNGTITGKNLLNM